MVSKYFEPPKLFVAFEHRPFFSFFLQLATLPFLVSRCRCRCEELRRFGSVVAVFLRAKADRFRIGGIIELDANVW